MLEINRLKTLLPGQMPMYFDCVTWNTDCPDHGCDIYHQEGRVEERENHGTSTIAPTPFTREPSPHDQ